MGQVWDGNHVFIWQLDQIDGGNVDTMIQTAKNLGYTGVLIKFADGSLQGDPNSQKYMDGFIQSAPKFKAAGFTVGGWIYQYLTDVPGEVQACDQAVQAGADWLVLDGEDSVANKGTEVTRFGQQLRSKHPTIPIGLTSFPIYNLHQEIPFQQYAAFCNVMIPQIYWALMGWTVDNAFQTTLDQYRQHFKLPIAPVGQCYGGATTDQIRRFITLAQNAGLPGISWWTWQSASAQQLQATQTYDFGPASGSGSGTGSNTGQSNGGSGKLVQFSDVSDSRWSAPYIQQMVKDGIMVGYPDGTFRPGQPLTREELAAALSKVMDLVQKPSSGSGTKG